MLVLVAFPFSTVSADSSIGILCWKTSCSQENSNSSMVFLHLHGVRDDVAASISGLAVTQDQILDILLHQIRRPEICLWCKWSLWTCCRAASRSSPAESLAGSPEGTFCGSRLVPERVFSRQAPSLLRRSAVSTNRLRYHACFFDELWCCLGCQRPSLAGIGVHVGMDWGPTDVPWWPSRMAAKQSANPLWVVLSCSHVSWTWSERCVRAHSVRCWNWELLRTLLDWKCCSQALSRHHSYHPGSEVHVFLRATGFSCFDLHTFCASWLLQTFSCFDLQGKVLNLEVSCCGFSFVQVLCNLASVVLDDLLHEFANTKVFCLFYNCMWQSRHPEGRCLSPRTVWTNQVVVHKTSLPIRTWSASTFSSASLFWSERLTDTGTQLENKSPCSFIGAFAIKQDTFVDFLSNRTGWLLTLNKSPRCNNWIFGLWLGFVGSLFHLQQLREPNCASSNCLWRKSLEEVEVTQILSRTYDFSSFPS